MQFSVEVIDAGLVINGNALVTIADIEASNGIVHVINAVIIEEESRRRLVFAGCMQSGRGGLRTATTNVPSSRLLRGRGRTHCLGLNLRGSAGIGEDSIGGIVENNPEFATLNTAC